MKTLKQQSYIIRRGVILEVPENRGVAAAVRGGYYSPESKVSATEDKSLPTNPRSLSALSRYRAFNFSLGRYDIAELKLQVSEEPSHHSESPTTAHAGPFRGRGRIKGKCRTGTRCR